MREKTRQKHYSEIRNSKKEISEIDKEILSLQDEDDRNKKYYPYISKSYDIWCLNKKKQLLLNKISKSEEALNEI